MTKRTFLIIVLFLFFTLQVFSADNVLKINIEGNNIVSDATIISKIKIRTGQLYNKNIINEDIKNLYATGFFETVEVEKQETSEGIIAVFKVREKSILKKLTIKGNKKINTKLLMSKVIKETLPSYVSGKVKAKVIDVKQGAFLDEYALKQTKQKIEDFYRLKGFSGVSVSYTVENVDDKNEVKVVYTIDEGSVVKVRDVEVMGNKFVSRNKIKKIIKTRDAWLFNRGVFKKDVLSDDIKRVTDYYKSKGFSDVVVNIDTEYKTKGVYISVKVNEGKRYFIGVVSIEGNKNVSIEDINEVIKVKDGDVYSEQVIYEVSSRIRGIYIDRGYIFSQVEPFSFLSAETGKINIDFRIIENEIAFIEDINIKGNTKTKDKVIRRELKVYPGDKFDGKKVRRSKEKLENLGFFEEIRFGTDPGDEPNNVDLVVDVKEAKTGYFSFGGGYSSVDEFMGFVELRQRNFDFRNFSNFTGAGQDLSLMLSMGNLTERYQLSFTNPWIFDKPLSFGFDLYKRGHDQDDNVGYGYSEQISGGTLRLERELSDYWKGGVNYKYERVDISDIVSGATELVKELGVNNLSSGEVSLSFDSRDNVFAARKGIYLYNSLQLFGGPFAGDRDFVKYFSRFSVFLPALEKSVIEIKLRGGFSDTFADKDGKGIPIYEKFFAGGSSTVRGYRERKVGPIDSATNDPIGGERMLIGNLEYTHSLIDFLKVAAFYDVGKVWGGEGSNAITSGFKSSIGLGVRVKTPIGPISIDYGWPLDNEVGETDKQGRFHFNVSREF